MSGQLQNGEQQFFDNNGKPLKGGTIDFYVPNTTTRKTTWQDQALTIQNTNPIVLDAGGRAIIWGSGSYRQVLKDNNGNLIWDQIVSDPVTSLTGQTGASQVGADDGVGGSIFTTVSGFISSLKSSIGASLVGFIQAGAGAVIQTVQNILREKVSVSSFGASPSASASVNTAAFNAAALAVRRAGDGYLTSIAGRIFIPNGVYQLNGDIGLYNGTYLDGESAGGVILMQQDPTKRTIYNVDAVTGIDNTLTIKRIVVSYSSQATDPAAIGVSVISTTAISPVIEDVTVYKAYHGFLFERTINLIRTRCYSINCTFDGVVYQDSLDGAHNSAVVENGNYSAGCGRWGFSGTVIGSSFHSVAADRCETGFHITLLNSTLQGSTEACVAWGAHIINSEGYKIQLYNVPATGATDGFWLDNSPYGTIEDSTLVWGGGGTGYSVRTSGTTANIIIKNSVLARFGVDYYNDTSIITTIGGALSIGATTTANPSFTVGSLPKSGHGAISGPFSGGSGSIGADDKGGIRVAGSNGYGISMQAWDSTFPRWGIFGYGGEVPGCIMEGNYASVNSYIHSVLCIKSPDNTWHGIRVANDGTLSTFSVPAP